MSLFSPASVLARLAPICCVALACAQAADPPWPVALRLATNAVGRYEKIEMEIHVPETFAELGDIDNSAPPRANKVGPPRRGGRTLDLLNPFDPDEVDLQAELTSPSGQLIHVPAFWHQPYERRRLGVGARGRDWFYPAAPGAWKVRFAPAETGTYTAVAVLKSKDGKVLSGRVTFQSLPSKRKGFLQTSRTDPRFFEFSNGQPFFAIGQNLAFIGNQQYVGLSKAEEIFDKLSSNGANYLRVWTCCEDWAMAIEARKSAFGRSWDWHAPIVPVPDAESSGRKCLRIATDKKVLRIDPSHPVALRPETSYVFSGEARQEAGVALQLELNGTSTLLPAPTGSAPAWKPFTHEFKTGADAFWLPSLSLRTEGKGAVWVGRLSLKEAAGGPELLWEADVNRPVRGYYNPLDCFILDELLSAAEAKGTLLQLCFLTRDLYMNALKEPASADYDQAIADARKAFRYVIARWGYSTSVAAWEYWNEMNPGLPTEKFYAAVGEYLAQADPYKHLRTTSTWGPSAKDCRHPQLDVADVHFYLRPSDKGRLLDEVDAVLERTKWLREQAPSKPAHLGEFGLANEKWQPREEAKASREVVDMHNALWASALSGASGTAMFWWWERLDQQDFYAHYRPLSQFVADVPWNSGDVRAITANSSAPGVRVAGLRARERAWLWLFNQEASWGKIVLEKKQPAMVSRASIQLGDCQGEKYRIRWWHTREGRFVREEHASSRDGVLRLVAPDFSHDIACAVSRASNP